MALTSKDIVAVVLAGGYGTRIKHLLPHNLPKPMVPVAGKPFLEWVVRYLRQQGITRVILSTGYSGDVIRSHFASQPVEGVRVTCSREISPSGTGGGFLHGAASQRESPPAAWLVVNGDSLIFTPLAPLINSLQDETIEGAILGLSVRDTSRYGSLGIDGEGNLVRFAEKRDGAGVINAGVYLFDRFLLQKFPSRLPLSFEREVFPALIARGVRLQVTIVDAPFLDIGTPESLPLAEAFIKDNYDRFAPDGR